MFKLIIKGKQRSGYMCPACGAHFLATGSIKLDIELDEKDINYQTFGTGVDTNNERYYNEEAPINLLVCAAPTVFCNNCDEAMIQIDEGLFTPVVALNKHGIKTAFCCEGHKNEFDCEETILLDFDPNCDPVLKTFEDGTVDLVSNSGDPLPSLSSAYIDIINDGRFDDEFFKKLREYIDNIKSNWDCLKDIKYYVGPTTRYNGCVGESKLIEINVYYETKSDDEDFDVKKSNSLLFMLLITNEFVYLANGGNKNV